MTRNLLLFIYVKQTFLICWCLILKESRISVWRIYVNILCIDLVQIAICQQSILELILPVAETNIYNKTNITLSSGLYENMK